MTWPFGHVRCWRPWILFLLLLGLQGCASLYKPQNESITKIDNHQGYRLTKGNDGDYGDHLIFLAFSGGGTRAAALSYGLLKELKSTDISSRGHTVRLLDEVDSISSVSGGSFTAAYYGLFGERLFSDYESVFLRQSIQGTLIRNLFSPVYWWNAAFDGMDRTEMAIDYYDRQIFEGKTFRDMQLERGPFIEINATDLAVGQRFSFIQASFDLICSDLDDFSVARAVTASSAVPVAFPTVVLKNYSEKCDTSQSNLVRYLKMNEGRDPRIKMLKTRMDSYLNAKERPYIHLVDGGISDNLGLRALSDRIETQGAGYFLREGKPAPKDILVITVNAQVKPERGMDYSAEKPSVSETIDAMADAQMSLYNNETKLLLKNKLTDLQAMLKAKGRHLKIYTAEVAFDSVEAKTVKSLLNSLPTSLELSNQDVDLLIGTASQLLREQSGYQEFLADNQGRRQGQVQPQPQRSKP